METIEGTAATITAGAAADDVDPSHHEAEQQNLSDDVDDDEDRRTRIMELAQQQQMTIQLLDRVVANQRNLQGNLNESRLRRRRRQRDNDDGLVGQLLEEEGQPPGNDNDMPRMQHHPPNHNHMHRHREGGSLFTVTQIYFIVSALFAFLAVVTSPSTGRGVPLFSQLQYSFDKNVQNEAVKTSSDHAEQVVEMSAIKKYRGAAEVDDNYPSKGQDSSDGAVGRSNEEFFRPPSWHYQSHHRSMKTTNTERAPKKVKMGLSPSENKLTWEELLSESFENIRDHYKEQYIILQNFWMYGTLTNISNPSSTTNSQREEDLLVWSIFPWNWGRKSPAKKNDDAKKLISLSQTTSGGISKGKKFSLYSIAMDVIDPPPYHAPVEESAADTASGARSAEERKISSAGSLAEKILSSTPRLIAIANLLLALVYLIHAAIADLFLGPSNVTQSRQRGEQQGNAADDQTRRQRRMGREKLGGYLLFKLLLISSVLDPGTDDLLILFSWYMVLSFLRSLTHLAGSTANRVSRSGQPPRPGTLRLLMAVFICDVIAAAGCIVLFRGAGWHLLLLLTCDCALVAADTMAHIVKYFGLSMEERHRSQISSTEEELANLRRRNRREQLEQYRNELLSAESEYINDAQFNVSTLPVRPEARLEREIEERELVHTRRMKIVDVAVFLFEMSALILTMVHFIHIWIWAWHGTFGLVDFVLALHLHSTISIIGKKVRLLNACSSFISIVILSPFVAYFYLLKSLGCRLLNEEVHIASGPN